jgi:MYXO-CTERM domain-containing protein
MQGSHTGGLQQNADLQTIGYDPATKSIVNLGRHSGVASFDRHLYSNYLGNNPGNQGRNFAGADTFKNPLVGPASKVTHYTAYAVTGKAPMHTDSQIKPSLYVSLFPVAFTADAPDPQGGYNDNVPGDETPDDPAPEEPDPITPGGDGFASGGCSTGAGNGGGLLGLGLALALTLRRRSRKAE